MYWAVRNWDAFLQMLVELRPANEAADIRRTRESFYWAHVADQLGLPWCYIGQIILELLRINAKREQDFFFDIGASGHLQQRRAGTLPSDFHMSGAMWLYLTDDQFADAMRLLMPHKAAELLRIWQKVQVKLWHNQELLRQLLAETLQHAPQITPAVVVGLVDDTYRVDLSTKLAILNSAHLKPFLPDVEFGEKWWGRQVPQLTLLLDAMSEMGHEAAQALFLQVTDRLLAAKAHGFMLAFNIFQLLKPPSGHPHAEWLREEAIALLTDAGYVCGVAQLENSQIYLRWNGCKYVRDMWGNASFSDPEKGDFIAFHPDHVRPFGKGDSYKMDCIVLEPAPQ